jgi:hypothetical protein
MIKTILLSVCIAASWLSLDARAEDASALSRAALAQNDRQYTDGPVTQVDYIQVEYGHFDEYVAWLNSTWKPTMEAMKRAELIVDYHVFQATPRSPDQPNIYLMITYRNAAAALDNGVELEYVARNVICSTACQNQARAVRNGFRRVLGHEYLRELILK